MQSRRDEEVAPVVDPIIEAQKEVQRRLAAAGFYHGEIDGSCGTDTYAAMSRYRMARGI